MSKVFRSKSDKNVPFAPKFVLTKDHLQNERRHSGMCGAKPLSWRSFTAIKENGLFEASSQGIFSSLGSRQQKFSSKGKTQPEFSSKSEFMCLNSEIEKRIRTKKNNMKVSTKFVLQTAEEIEGIVIVVLETELIDTLCCISE